LSVDFDGQAERVAGFGRINRLSEADELSRVGPLWDALSGLRISELDLDSTRDEVVREEGATNGEIILTK